MNLSNQIQLVNLVNNKSVTTSRLIAYKFNKRHADVLRSIDDLSCSGEFRQRNFASSFYISDLPGGGQKQLPEYIITKDGFVFLVMGFTGVQAAQFKEEYINAFNEMEHRLQPLTNQMMIEQGYRLAIQETERLKMELVKAQPKVQYVDTVLLSQGTYTTTQIAKELGFSAKRLHNELKLKGVMFKQGKTWVLYAKYQDRGYTKTRTNVHSRTNSTFDSHMYTVWTELGRAFVHNIFNPLKKTA